MPGPTAPSWLLDAGRFATGALLAGAAALILSAQPARAQIPGLTSEPAEPAVVQVPDPRSLKPDWWTYLGNAGDELESRAEALKQSINQAVLSLAVADSNGINEQAERARRGIQAYVEEFRKAAQPLEATLRTSGTFTLNELLETQRRFWSIGIESREEADRLAQSRALTASVRRRLDPLIQSYGSGALDPVARLRTGVEMIAERAELALAELRAARRQGRVEQLEAYRKQLENQLAYARRNLKPGAWEAAASEQTLEGLKGELEELRKELAARRDRMLTIDESTTAGQIHGAQVRQDVLVGSVAQASKRLEIANATAQRLWHRLHDPEQPASDGELREPLVEFQALLAEVRSEFDAWQRANEAVLLEPPLIPSESRELELKAIDQRVRTQALETLREIRQARGAAAELALMVSILGEDLAAVRGGFRGWLERSRLLLTQGWNEGLRLLDVPMFRISDNPVSANSLLQVLVILLITFLLSALMRKALGRLGERRGVTDAHSLYAVGRLLHYLLIIIGVFFGLSTLGLDLGNLALIAGALSVGIGFGLQTTVSNFVSGLILLFDRSLKVGDYVELDSGYKGTVQEVTVRATRINTNDNVDVLVPNSEFVSTKLTNWTLKEPFARLRIPFGVAYGSDKEKVREVALAAAKRVDLTLYHMEGREPQVRLIGFGDSSLDFELLVWVSRMGVKRPGRSRAEYYWELETGLHEAGIEIPFPQRDLHLKSGFERDEPRRPFRAPRRRE